MSTSIVYLLTLVFGAIFLALFLVLGSYTGKSWHKSAPLEKVCLSAGKWAIMGRGCFRPMILLKLGRCVEFFRREVVPFLFGVLLLLAFLLFAMMFAYCLCRGWIILFTGDTSFLPPLYVVLSNLDALLSGRPMGG